MPRCARIKFPNATYHIMMRSVGNSNLFRSNRDKDKFLQLLRKYKITFMFDILAYCLMDTHVHLLINSNGADISKFMHGINQSYAQYFNNKHLRSGHVFGDRFKSTIAKQDKDLLCMCAYIHNNPKDIKGYRNCVENYKYSSFSIYLGTMKDKYNLINYNVILNYYGNDLFLKRKNFYTFVKTRLNSTQNTLLYNNFEFKNVPSQYVSGKKFFSRYILPNTVIRSVCTHFNIEEVTITLKYNKKISKFKSICIFILRGFCNLKFTEISNIFTNMTLSGLSNLYTKAYDLIINNSKYKNFLICFLNHHSKTSLKTNL